MCEDSEGLLNVDYFLKGHQDENGVSRGRHLLR